MRVGVAVGGAGVEVGVGVGVGIGVAATVTVEAAVGNTATGVAVGADLHATNNKRLKHAATLSFESKGFIFSASYSAKSILAQAHPQAMAQALDG